MNREDRSIWSKENNSYTTLWCRKYVVVAAALSGFFLSGCSDDLPDREMPKNVVWLDQNWTDKQRSWFHHADQGTQTFFMPLEWLVALEQPGLHIFNHPLLMESAYMQKLGFIPGEPGVNNPYALPVGFAVGKPLPDAPNYTSVGLTCAACHTGHLTYKGTSVRFDGGAAMIAPDQLMIILLKSMAETAYNKRQFSRFAERVLGEDITDEDKKSLEKEFKKSLMNLVGFTFKSIESVKRENIRKAIAEGESSNELKELVDAIKETVVPREGFARTDALTRIGNQVFSLVPGRPENFAPVSAPVSFPFIWNTSWFNWVQYDGSIMQPMVRNAGEALGVGATIVLDEHADNNFESSVEVGTLHEIEKTLAGEQPPFSTKSFNGLTSPKWPEDILGAIDQEKAAKGEELYREHCQKCHLPAPTSDKFWSKQVWSFNNANGDPLLTVPLIPIGVVGTDPQQSYILSKRTINTEGFGINANVQVGPTCENTPVKDDKAASYALSLAAVVQETVGNWYEHAGVTEDDQQKMNGYLPNCVQTQDTYKARPLNGVWATAPFLHNGSIPNLYALLSPVEERPTEFYVGNLEFDPVNVGYLSDKASGLYRYKVEELGNSNAGHEFSDNEGAGVIGPKLEEGERESLVEYLKTL